MQKTLSLIIAAAILYSIIQLQRDNKQVEKPISAEPVVQNHYIPSEEKQPVAPTGNLIEKTLSNVLINILKTEDGRMFLENIIQPMNKPLAGADQSYKINNTNFIQSMFKINTFGDGKVGPVSCGHIVKIQYQLLNLKNNVIDEQTRSYRLGSREIIPALDSIIVGMMVGQTRQAIVPAKYVYKNIDDLNSTNSAQFDAFYKVNVTLEEILPHTFANDEVKIYDDEIAYKLPLLCGERVVFDAKITKLSNGQVIYNSKLGGAKINMIIGDLNYPMVFSHALYSKIPIGIRTVIAKGKLFQSLANKVSKIFPKEQLPNDEYFMLELMNFDVQQ